jgi:hypothetical protein
MGEHRAVEKEGNFTGCILSESSGLDPLLGDQGAKKHNGTIKIFIDIVPNIG